MHQTYPLRFVNFGFSFTTSSIEYFSLRFSSPTHYDVWNDVTNQIVTDCVGCSGDATGTLPTYEEVSVYLQIAGLNEFVITTTYPFYPVEGAAPAKTGTLPTPPACVSASIGGYFFDPYEHAEYLNGFLAWHFRFAGSYPDGRTWTSHMNLHDAGCNLIGNSFQFYGTPTNLPPFTRYWSVRFSSPQLTPGAGFYLYRKGTPLSARPVFQLLSD